MQDIQFQQRTETLTDRDILKKLPQMIDLDTLTDDQQEFLQNHRQKTNLLKWLYNQKIEQQQMLERQEEFSVSSHDIEQTKLRLEMLNDNIKCAADELLLFEKAHSSIIKSLVQIGLPLIEAEEREKARQRLDEWRRQRDLELNKAPTPITDNLCVSESPKSVEKPPEIISQETGMTNIKDKLLNTLGFVGVILWYLVSLLIAVMPLVMIGASFWMNILFFGIDLIFPPSSIVFWIWGLICAIQGPQDAWAIIYYVLCAIMFLPFFISSILDIFNKHK